MDFSTAVPLVRLAGYKPLSRASSLLTEEQARNLGILPLMISSGKLVAACIDPYDRRAIQKASSLARIPILPVAATIPELRSAFDLVYHRTSETPGQPDPAEILYRLGHLTPATVKQAIQINRNGGKPPFERWLEAGLIDEDGLVEAYGWINYLPHLRPENIIPQPGISSLISAETARSQQVLPLWWLNGTLAVAVPCCDSRPTYPELLDLPGITLRQVLVSRQVWERLFRKIYLVGVTSSQPLQQILAELRETGLLSEADVLASQAVSANTGLPVERILLDRGIITQQRWNAARTRVLHYQVASLPPAVLWPSLYSLLPFEISKKLQIIPLEKSGDCLVLGMVNPQKNVIRFIDSLTGLKVEPRLVDEVELQQFYLAVKQADQPDTLIPNPGIIDILLGMGLINRSQLSAAQQGSQLPGEELTDTCLRLGLIDEADLCEAYSLQTGIPMVMLHHSYFDDALIRKIPFGLYANHQIMPVAQYGNDIWVAAADPLDNSGLLAVEEATGQRVWPLVAPRSVVVAALKHTFDEGMRSVPEQIRNVLQFFVRHQHISQVEASQALVDYSDCGTPLDLAIAHASTLSEDAVAQIIARYLGLMAVDLNLHEQKYEVIDAMGQRRERTHAYDPVDINAARLIDLDTALRFSALPIKRAGGEVGVAFASLPVEGNVRMLENLLSLKVIPLIASRTALENAIHRTLGRQNLGTRLLVAGLINRRQLNDALDLASRTGVRLGKALTNRGYITEQQLYRFLAEQSGLPYSHLDPAALDTTVAMLLPAETERTLGILPLSIDDGRLTIAVTDPLNEDALEKAAEISGMPPSPVLVPEADFERALEALYRQDYLNTSVLELLERAPEDSAYSVLSRGQMIFLVLAMVVSIIWLWFDHRSYLVLLNILSTIFYLAFSAYKFYLIYRAMNRDLEIPVSKADVDALDDRDLPVYTILVPVYRETGVLPDLIQALTSLDYPATKLDIKVLFEADDPETLDAFRKINPPPQFQAITIPAALPKTKPKACNYGLVHARGEFVVIFDAEDLPDRDQLKRVLVGFSRVPEDVVCIQTKLNYYNRNQNLLTRWFTVEYSMWFDLFLPGLDASRAPIPLGGTSNHFKKSALVEAGAWDPFNVTEDADLGMRIFKRGYRTAIVDSTTYEEANSQLYNWIRQRSRWIKGYIQTWLVHMRHPLRLWNELGPNGFLSFQLVVGGTFFAALMNPIYWTLTTLWFLGRWQFVETLYPGVIFFVGSICLYLGNFAFTYMNVAGAMRRGYYDMVKFALLSPLYWGLISIAAWRGLFQLLTRPHFWEKTVHGLTQMQPVLENQENPDILTT